MNMRRQITIGERTRRCPARGTRVGSCFLAASLLLALVAPGKSEEEQWSVPRNDHTLTFPRDHGSHPDFRIEWWYLTGHLFAGDRRFGFQATFFRLGQRPEAVPGDELFGDAQIFMAHMGLSDPDNGVFLHQERLNRAGWNARARVGDLDVRNGDWRLVRAGGALELRGSIRSDAEFELRLLPHKPHVIFGEDGISRKGPEGTAASYYITFPRLDAEGTLRIGGETMEVSGEAWMDHEISSSQLDENQVGWDWASIQFFDSREIMGYVLREADGGISPYSKLVWIDAEGKLTHQSPGDYRWVHQGEWESSDTGAVYPVSPRIETIDPETGEKRAFLLQPTMAEQEIVGRAGGVSYWEGACDVIDLETDAIVGRAFLEMTGYADDVAERLR